MKKALNRWINPVPNRNYDELHELIKKNIEAMASAKDFFGKPLIPNESATKAYMHQAMLVLFRDKDGNIKGEYLKAMEELIATIYVTENVVWKK